MKKIMIVASAAALVSGAFCAEAVKPVPPTFDEAKTILQDVKQIAVTNVVEANRIANRKLLPFVNSYLVYVGEEADAFRATVDNELSAVGICGPGFWYTMKNHWAVKMNQISFEREGLATNTPYAVSLGQKYGVYCAPGSFNVNVITADEFIGLINENLDLVNGKFRIRYGYASLESNRKKLQNACVKNVKKYLRSQGKSFVTKDGVNPCEGLMTELNNALNAPYMNGLNAWLAKIGIEARVNVSKLPKPTDVQVLKNAILNADKDMTPMDDAILKICLGVDGYNAFVKEYNGEQ